MCNYRSTKPFLKHEAQEVDRYGETDEEQRELMSKQEMRGDQQSTERNKNASGPGLEVENPNNIRKRFLIPTETFFFIWFHSEKNKLTKTKNNPLGLCEDGPRRQTGRRTLTSSLWLMDRAECSSALMTDAYESENLVYFPTRAMEHCSSSRSDLHRDTFNIHVR